MNSSLKIGAVSGLVAGIVAGIVMVFIASVLPSLGLTYWYLKPPPATPLTNIAVVEIANNAAWGILLGMIFIRIYDLIPTKGVSKGLIFGLVCHAFLNIRLAFFMYSYGYYLWAISAFLYIHPIIYGLVLGFLYKGSTQELEIAKPDKMWGAYSGVFASVVFSICVIIMFVELAILRTVEQPLDIAFLISQQGAHMVINMFWFGIFGAFYAMAYDRIPGKNLMKGLYCGLIFWLIASFRIGVYLLSYGFFESAISWGVFGPHLFIIWGLMLDAFYRKRAYVRAISISIVVFLIASIWIIVDSALGGIIGNTAPRETYLTISGIIRIIIIISAAIILARRMK